MLKDINGEKVDISPNTNLTGADLNGADLNGANLRGANLRGVNLSRASLRGADLSRADLSRANLNGADLRGANLTGADLNGADLTGANLRWANLNGADLIGAKNVDPFIYALTLITPEGDIIVYKALRGGVICKLLIPSAARRHNATGRKCRAEYAIVLEGEGYSLYDGAFYYKVGQTVRPLEPFCYDRWRECAPGIHFYLTRIEAENNQSYY